MAKPADVRVADWAVPLWNLTNRRQPRYSAFYGGRGGGKSWGISDALIARASRERLRILCAREVQRSIKDSVKRVLEDSIARLKRTPMFDVTQAEIRCEHTGSVFIFSGLRDNVDTVRSMEGIDICWVSEAQRISQNSLDVLIPTIRKPGSQLIFDWNPREPTDPVDKLFRGESPPPDSYIVNVNWDDNPDFPEVLREEMEYDKRRDPDKYQHIWLGGYLSKSDQRVFHNWEIEEFEHREGVTRRQGADWGFAVDPTVLVQAYIEGRKLYVEYEAYQVGCDIVDTPDLFGSVPEADKWPIIADGSRPETISHMRKNGFKRIYPAVKGAGSVEEGVEWLKSYDIIVHPRCRHTIDELSMYSYKADRHTGEILPKLEDRDNHVIDALRYAVEALRRSESQIERPKSKAIPNQNRW